MRNKILFNLAIFSGKLAYFILKIIGRRGAVLPGKIALKICPDILKDFSEKCDKIVLVTGTNGKTTTINLINHIVGGKYNNLVSNLEGANMIQGIVTPFIVNTKNHYSWGIFEVDEGSIHNITRYLSPNYVILTNFFRDQLDRYGEVDNAIKMVYDALTTVDSTIIINSDDPSIIQFNKLPNKKIYYGFNKNKFSKEYHSVSESIFCKECGHRLDYEFISYGNIGNYYCENCGSKRPKINYGVESLDIKDGTYEFTLSIDNSFNDKCNARNIENRFLFKYVGIYNVYNCLAAIAFCLSEEFDVLFVKNQVESFEYNLGRMEVINFSNKDVVLVLAKNPVGLSEVLNSISYDESPKNIMFCLNDTPADGKDPSWIWDADFEQIMNINHVNTFYCSGIRANEVLLRLKYIDFDTNKIKTYISKNINDFKKPVREILYEDEKSYIIGTFTTIFRLRKILLREKSKE